MQVRGAIVDRKGIVIGSMLEVYIVSIPVVLQARIEDFRILQDGIDCVLGIIRI